VSGANVRNDQIKKLSPPLSSRDINKQLVQVVAKESQALDHLISHFPDNAYAVVTKILATTGRVVFSGHGKSGAVARKLTATFSSLGIPSFFLHPSDALHGDLGMVLPADLCIVLSKSGTGDEFEQLIPIMRSQGNEVILLCCHKGSLATRVDLVLALPFRAEACQHNLAPTSSSTLMMAFGDALAVVVSSLQHFSEEDFARRHPSGALGNNFFLTVHALMHSFEELSILHKKTPFKDLLVSITSKKLGVGVVLGAENRLQGIITDGDLRRACEQGVTVFSKTAHQIMTVSPKVIAPEVRAYKALEKMEEFAITSLVVVERERVVGLLHIHSLLKAGIVS